ncbi:MAG: S8 family peptidase [Bacteroidota bacterium]
MKIRLLLSLVLIACVSLVYGQDKAPENWFLLDPSTDNMPGLSIDKTYNELLKGKDAQPVIVAVIDSGVDYLHEDLKDVMWVNQDEIPDNGIDDDKNGYVDDIHGWNFIGGKDGRNIHHDALEVSRLAAKYGKKYENADVSKLSKKDKKEYEKYQDIKKVIAEKREEVMQQSMGVTMFSQSFEAVRKFLKKDKFTAEDLKAIETDNEEINNAVSMIQAVLDRGASLEDLEGQLSEANEYFENQLKHYYNPEFDPRAEIVKDNYADLYERDYGNNNVKGPDANHGTHVAGIIAASRDNDLGMQGIANNVLIMSVRCVPDGDERDKDVANAIIYAVDNGASIINMSFGKSYAWNKDVVDKAVRYAMKKDVLLVHAAGNDGKDNDNTNNFPNDKFRKKKLFKPKYAKNWIEVGALHWKGGEELPASFSNYGKENVDIFAPGVAIYSTVTENEYDSYPGTSMASPMVAGVAALIRSYCPTLTAQQVKEVILSSAVKQNQQVVKPGSDDKVAMSELSRTGGTLSAYTAVKKALSTKGKKKVKKKSTQKAVKP